MNLEEFEKLNENFENAMIEALENLYDPSKKTQKSLASVMNLTKILLTL